MPASTLSSSPLSRRILVGLAATATLVLSLTVSNAGAQAAPDDVPAVSPGTYSVSAEPGDTFEVTKTVSTPTIAANPDIVILVDRTGSMGPPLNNLKANIAGLISEVHSVQPNAQFAIATYCDFDEPVPPFEVVSDLTADTNVVLDATESVELCHGGDAPEGQLNALWEIGADGGKISFRPDSSRIVVWFGDAPGHDPSGGHTLDDAIGSLTGAAIRVVAVSVISGGGLDQTGQATAITEATGGVLLSGVNADDLSEAILEGLSAEFPVEVTATPVCEDGLSVSLEPATQIVASGMDAVFAETITVADDAQRGTTISCQVEFTLNGIPGGADFTQAVSIEVNPSVTDPVVVPTPPKQVQTAVL